MHLETYELLDRLNLKYQPYEHEPVLDYETAAMVDEKYHIEGVESKSLLMKTKSGKYYLLITTSDQRMDRKYMKQLLGEKVSIAAPEELMELAGYEAGCAAPFCYPKEVGFLVDTYLFTLDKIIISAGISTLLLSPFLKQINCPVPADIQCQYWYFHNKDIFQFLSVPL